MTEHTDEKDESYIDTTTMASKVADEWEKHLDFATKTAKQYGKTGIRCVAGRVVEDLHSTTFNVDAIKKGQTPRAYTTTKTPGRALAPSDIDIVDKGKLVGQVQSKLCKTATKTTFDVSKPKYDGMQKVVASDQVEKVKSIATKAAARTANVSGNNYADTAKNASKDINYKGVKSEPLTRKQAIQHAKDLNQKVQAKVQQEILSSVGNATALGASFSAVTSSYRNIKRANSGEIDGEEAVIEILKDTGKGALDSGSKALLGAGLARTGAQLFKGNGAFVAATMAIDAGKDLFDWADGEIDGGEFAIRTGKNAAKTSGGLAGAELGAMLGTAVFPGAGTFIGGIIGGTLGFMGVGSLFN